MKVKLVDTVKPPACQSRVLDRKNLKKWAKVRGMTIEVEPATPFTHLWPCGTDTIFRITDSAYREKVGAIQDQPLFVCKHQVEEIIP